MVSHAQDQRHHVPVSYTHLDVYKRQEVNTFKFAFAEELKLSLRGVMRQARENNRVQEHEGFVDVMSRVIQQNLSASRKMMGTMNSVKVWWRA